MCGTHLRCPDHRGDGRGSDANLRKAAVRLGHALTDRYVIVPAWAFGLQNEHDPFAHEPWRVAAGQCNQGATEQGLYPHGCLCSGYGIGGDSTAPRSA